MTAENPTLHPPEAVDASAGTPAVEEAGLCVKSVARQLVPPQLTGEGSTVEVAQDPDAWDRLFSKRRPAGLGTISNMTTGFVRPKPASEHMSAVDETPKTE